MKAVLVAGGRGERLRPITDSIPKPMVEVVGKPILEHLIVLLRNNGITDLVVALCYLPEVITNYFGSGKKFGVNIKYTYEDPQQPLGTAGAIRGSKKFLESDFIVTYADILRKLDVLEMITQHQDSGTIATLNVYKEYDEIPRSEVKIGNNNEILDFVENPKIINLRGQHVWTNGSFYMFSPSIFEFIGDKGSVDFAKDVFPSILTSKEKIYAYKTNDYFIDIGTLEKLEEASKTFNP